MGYSSNPLQVFVNGALYCGGVIAIVLMYAWRQPRRSNFALRVTLCCIGVEVLAALFSALAAYAVPITSGWYIIVQILRFIAIFSFSGITVKICFRCGLWEVLFFMTIGYCTQHISARAGGIFSDFIVTGMPWQLRSFVGKFFNALIYFLFWFFYARKRLREATISIADKAQLMAAICVVGVSIIYSSYATSFANGVIVLGDEVRGKQLLLFVYIMTAIIAVLAFMLSVNSNKLKYYTEETQALTRFLDDRKARYEQDKLNVERINMRLHDLKHYIGSLSEEDFVSRKQEILEHIGKYDSGFNSGNDALDTLFTNKSIQCAEKGIRFNGMIAGVRFPDIPAFELYTIFCNAIDNAMEAVERLPEEKRIISVTARNADENKTAILIENYFEGEIRFAGGLPQSDQKGDLHGVGVKSMKMLAEKYGGSFRVNVYGESFSLEIAL